MNLRCQAIITLLRLPTKWAKLTKFSLSSYMAHILLIDMLKGGTLQHLMLVRLSVYRVEDQLVEIFRPMIMLDKFPDVKPLA